MSAGAAYETRAVRCWVAVTGHFAHPAFDLTDWQRVSGVGCRPAAVCFVGGWAFVPSCLAMEELAPVWDFFFYISFRKGSLHVFIYLCVYTSENVCFYI